MASSAGQKVTNDPRAENRIPEAVGTVTSDSLAAESQSFGQGNPKAGISQQPSSSSTLNTTDTSAARKLDPAPDEEAREAQQGWSEDASLKAGRGLGEKDKGIGPTYNTSSTSSTGGKGVPVAPTAAYAGSAIPPETIPPETQKPKGKDITEGGFDSGAPNASFNQEIGTKKDPGRVAEGEFERKGAEPGVTTQKVGDGETGTVYRGLSSEQSA